ncbi:MAG: PQQ-like beta-propeller repeat protein [Bacteroidales bacterium]|nr:PQQ-like beta-propeller repeat protein [Bacteroidales bacterium]
MAISVFGGLICGLVIIVWWAFFSRAPKSERWIAIILMIVALIVIPRFTHKSIVTGLNNLMYFVYAIPTLTIAFVIWAVITQKLSPGLRRITMVLTILFACGVWTLVRSDSLSGNASANFSWRWAETNEEKLLAKSEEESVALTSNLLETEAEWPGFRGPNRDGIIHGVRIETDWKASPPIELWRKAIGPGCSSFAIHGELFFTQEQRGEDEVVSCYNLLTGKPVWQHSDKARFWDSHAGAGPRSTPTLRDSLVYTLGATGIVNVLDIRDGSVVWSRNDASKIDTVIPGWGYASSPLVVDDVVIVAISGTLIAYDIATGEPRWFGPDGGENYSSPHLVTIDGIKQVLMMSQFAISSFVPGDGKLLWEQSWENGAIVQPAITADGDILISEGYKKAMHRITVSNNSGDWTIEKRWTTTKIRNDFNDFVIHKGHIYGFDGFSINCIDIKDGSRKWKRGRYGGQIILLADQDLLLVLTEKGELVLVEATPEQLVEHARLPAIEGKTWNHPVLVNDILLVRNTQEMVAFKLLLADD